MKFDEQVQRFLKEKHFAKLATIMKDGRPQVTPVWYMYEDGRLWVNTSKDRVKFRNIKRDPRVCLLIDEGYSYVAIWGKARVATERDAKKDIETLAIRYQGGEKGRKEARERYWKQARVSLEIIPEKVVKAL